MPLKVIALTNDGTAGDLEVTGGFWRRGTHSPHSHIPGAFLIETRGMDTCRQTVPIKLTGQTRQAERMASVCARPMCGLPQ